MEERAQYDQGVRERQRAAEEREGLEQAQRQEEERRELLEYRKTLDFKASFNHTHTHTHTHMDDNLPRKPIVVFLSFTSTKARKLYA